MSSSGTIPRADSSVGRVTTSDKLLQLPADAADPLAKLGVVAFAICGGASRRPQSRIDEAAVLGLYSGQLRRFYRMEKRSFCV